MLVASHLVVFLLNEYFPPVWQKNIRDITREVVLAMKEADKNTQPVIEDSKGFYYACVSRRDDRPRGPSASLE